MGSAGYEASFEDVKADIARLREILRGPVFTPPLMLSGGLLASLVITVLRVPEEWGSVALSLSLLAAFVGGALEIYYLAIIFWSFRVLRGGYLGFTDFIVVLASVGLYYVLAGIALISYKLKTISSQALCPQSPGVIVSVATLGFALSLSQLDTARCLESKLSELEEKLKTPSQPPVEGAVL
ncbi:MAG: hypothetical protein P3X22_003085 [Thermoprotei archaeon]|nr:hypothetical protein [Thermoprotei archaeon]